MSARRILNRYSSVEHLRGPVAAHGNLIPVYGRNDQGQLELVFAAPNDDVLKAILNALSEVRTDGERTEAA